MMPTYVLSSLCAARLLLVAASVGAHADSVQLERAQQHYEQHEWQAALNLFLAAAQVPKTQTQALAHFYAAECALQLKEYQLAAAEYRRVLDRDTAQELRIRCTFRVAEAKLLAGDQSRALVDFQTFVELYSRHELTADAHNYLGEIWLDTAQYDAALDAFGFVIDNSRGVQVDRARLGMANTLISLNRCEDVGLALGRLCQSADSNTAGQALLVLGRSQYEAGRYEDALATFRRVYGLEVVPHLSNRARLAAGWALWKLFRLQDVRAEVQPIAADSEYAGEYHYLIGMTAYSAKQWDDAISALELAANVPGAHQPVAMFYCGDSALLRGNPKRASASFQGLIDKYPNSEWADDAVWGLARAAQADHSDREIQQACNQLRAHYPASDYVQQLPLVEHLRGNQLRQGQPSERSFDEAVSLERDGRLDGALAAYHEFVEHVGAHPLRAEGLWRVARLHDRLKHRDEARKFYTQLLDEFPTCERAPAALASLACIADAGGDREVAAKYCCDLVAKFPQSAQAVEASYWLALLAADEKKSDEAQWQVDWLLVRLDPADRVLSDQECRVYGQTLCLQCQLFADDEKWQEIETLLGRQTKHNVAEAIAARLEFWRAEAAFRLGRYAEASTRFEGLVALTVGMRDSWVPMVTLRRAQLAERREVWQEVMKLVNELDDRFPEFELAYECDYVRGRAHAGRGEMSAARQAYGEVLANDWATGTETAAMAQWMIGETHFHQRNYDLAQNAYDRVIEWHNYPEWQARAALQAGKCAELGKKWIEASKYYADALEKWRQTESGKELAARLQWVDKQVAQQQAALRR